MAHKQTAKFVYNSKVQIIDEVRQNNPALVSSAGIFSAIRNMSSSALLDSGYVADCIINIKKNNTVNIVDGNVTIGSEDYDNKFFIPAGYDEDGVAKFDYVVLPAGEIITGVRHLKDDLVVNGEFAVLYDTEEKRVLLHPTRVGRTNTDGEVTDGFFQYIFARYQNQDDPESGYGPRTDNSSLADEWTIWWDLTDNIIKENVNHVWVPRRYSIPIGLITVENGEIVGFANDFTVAGYLEKALWINPGVTFNFPEGRDTNNSGTIICNPKISGRTEEGEDTNQPILKIVLDEEEQVDETFTYYFDVVNPLNNTITYIKLSRRCLDLNTLSIHITRGGITSKVTVGTYKLADDAKTIILDNPIVLTNSEDEEHGGVVVNTTFFDTMENMPLYVTDTWEVIGPTDELVFDNTTGSYVNLAGDKITCCRFAVMNSGYIVPKNLRPEEPLCITAFTPRTCFTLADNDDIENIMALIGSATGETMDQVLTDIEEIEAHITELDKDHRQLIAETSEAEVRRAEAAYIHIDGNETINGIKTFPEGIRANINGTAAYFDKSFGVNEIMPMGVAVFYAQTAKGISGNVEPNVSTIFLNDTRNDGTLVIKCINDNANVVEAKDIQDRFSNVEYKKGDLFRIDASTSATNKKFKIFEVLGGVGTSEDPTHEYTNQDPVSVMKSEVRIGKDYIKADRFLGTALQAKWADLAETYEADAEYAPGTLIRFGGEKEITLANFGECNGVISTAPAYLMNAEAKGLPVAMIGRVPVRVFGAIKKFDKIYMNMAAPGTACTEVNGEAIGIALEENDFIGEKLVTCVVKLKF